MWRDTLDGLHEIFAGGSANLLVDDGDIDVGTLIQLSESRLHRVDRRHAVAELAQEELKNAKKLYIVVCDEGSHIRSVSMASE